MVLNGYCGATTTVLDRILFGPEQFVVIHQSRSLWRTIGYIELEVAPGNGQQLAISIFLHTNPDHKLAVQLRRATDNPRLRIDRNHRITGHRLRGRVVRRNKRHLVKWGRTRRRWDNPIAAIRTIALEITASGKRCAETVHQLVAIRVGSGIVHFQRVVIADEDRREVVEHRAVIAQLLCFRGNFCIISSASIARVQDVGDGIGAATALINNEIALIAYGEGTFPDIGSFLQTNIGQVVYTIRLIDIQKLGEVYGHRKIGKERVYLIITVVDGNICRVIEVGAATSAIPVNFHGKTVTDPVGVWPQALIGDAAAHDVRCKHIFRKEKEEGKK